MENARRFSFFLAPTDFRDNEASSSPITTTSNHRINNADAGPGQGGEAKIKGADINNPNPAESSRLIKELSRPKRSRWNGWKRILVAARVEENFLFPFARWFLSPRAR